MCLSAAECWDLILAASRLGTRSWRHHGAIMESMPSPICECMCAACSVVSNVLHSVPHDRDRHQAHCMYYAWLGLMCCSEAGQGIGVGLGRSRPRGGG
jgi:hypothetical protein